MTKTEIRNTRGYPELYINGVNTAPVMFTQWVRSPEKHLVYPEYEKSAQYIGTKIYQPRLDMGSTVAQWSFFLDDIMEKDPNAVFLLPIWVQNVQVPADHMDSTATGFCSMDSPVWREKAVEHVNTIVRGFMNSSYGDRVIGFMITAGNTGEWFNINTYQNPSPNFDVSKGAQEGFRAWLKTKYGTDAAIKSAWNSGAVTLQNAAIPAIKTEKGPFIDPKAYQSTIDYMEFHSEAYARGIDTMCKAVHDASGGRYIAGAPYGYVSTLGRFNNISGSVAMEKLLHMKNVDYLCSPLDYMHRDLIDYPGWHGFADSVGKHGKLWFSEDDSPTYLSTDESYAYYKHVNTLDESRAMLWKNFMSTLTKRMGSWWYDNSGYGSFHDKDLLYNMRLMVSLSKKSLEIKYSSTTKIAVVIDETSTLYQTPGKFTQSDRYSFNEDLSRFRYYCGMLGAAVDTISFGDIAEGKADSYKMLIFANAYALTGAQRAAVNKLKKDNRTLIFTKTPGIIDIDAKAPSLSAVKDLTGIDLRLSKSSTNTKMPYGKTPYGDARYVDSIGNLTEAAVNTLFSGFTNQARPHMYAVPGSGDTVIEQSPDGKAVVVKSKKTGYTAYFADDISLLTPERLKAIAREAGVTVYTDSRAVAVQDNKFVSLTFDGKKAKETIYFNGLSKVYDYTNDQEYTVSGGTITVNCGKPSTFVFYLGTKKELGIDRPGK